MLTILPKSVTFLVSIGCKFPEGTTNGRLKYSPSKMSYCPGWVIAIWPALLVAVNAAQLAAMIQRSRTGDQREEERELLGHVLGIEEPAGQRRLRDLLRWRDVAEGEVLIREGQAEPPLVYIARGIGRVEHDGRPVGVCGAGDFLGEMSLVSGQLAIAIAISTRY